MQTSEIFAILGIEATKDEKAIKNAYRQQLVHTNPEDNPEGFKKLRAAYEEACVYAGNEEEQEEQPQKDTTPSGIWAEKAAALYESISTRCNEEMWKKLFGEDVFISLEGNEECRRKLLIFMMNHFNFPDCVWSIIAHELQIRETGAKLKEQFPQDYVDFLVRRCLTKEVIDYSLFQGDDKADYDSYIRYYNAAWDCLHEKDYDKLKELLAQADETGITHPYMELTRVNMFRNTGDVRRAQDMIEKLHAQYPKDSTILYQLAEFYYETKQQEKAVPCYESLKAGDNNHYMANYRLAYLYAEQEKYEAAKECIRMVMRRGQDDAMQELRNTVNHKLENEYLVRWTQNRDVTAAKELAWCYLQDDRFLAADKLTQEMEAELPDEIKAEYLGLCARIYMAQGKFEKTLETTQKWQKQLEQISVPEESAELAEYNRDVEIAHRIKMSVYHMMGRCYHKYYAKALEEFEFYQRQKDTDPNALIDAARIYLEQEEYQKCLNTAEVLLNQYQIQYAYALMLEAYVKLWDAGNVIHCGMECIQYFPNYERPYEEVAKVYYDLKQQDKLQEILELAQKNQVSSAYLDAYAYTEEEKEQDYPIGKYLDEFKNNYAKKLAETGQMEFYQEGYPIITKYLNLYPCNYIINTRGLFSMAAKKYEEALKDFYKIQERDPADQFALNNIGCVLKYTGRYEEALPYFERAWYYMYREGKEEPNAMPLGNMAHTYELLGEYELAAGTYRRLYDDNNEQKNSLMTMKDLTSNYARSGELAKAVEVLKSFKNREEYVRLLYRMYLYAADWQSADLLLEDMFKEIKSQNCLSGKALAAKNQRLLECEHRLAWKQLRNKRAQEALETINRAITLKQRNSVAISTKEYADLLANKLFILSVLRFSKQEKPSFMEKVKGLFGLHSYEKQGKECAQKLYSLLQEVQGAFFYKERYVKYLEYMMSLYTGDDEKIRQALGELGESSRCRLCNHGECMRHVTAKALYAAYQGRKEEAKEICAGLLERQPYNLYALCGIQIGMDKE